MKMKKTVPFALSAMLVGGALVPAAVFANDEAISKSDEAQKEVAFIKTEGTIQAIEKNGDVTLYTIKHGEESPVLAVTNETLVYDNTGEKVELKKGDKVTAYTDANKPMILIYPPQYSPDAVIVETEKEGFTAVGTFDEELTDMQLKLQLHIDDEKTKLESASGKEVKAEDLKEQNLLVFYTVTTRSIPAQTTPEKVIVLDTEQEEGTQNGVDDIIANDHYEKNGVKMVPLRLIAEELDYKVKSTGKGAILSKGAMSYTVTRGDVNYGYNKSIVKLDAAPELLEQNKTYVPEAFIEELMKH